MIRQLQPAVLLAVALALPGIPSGALYSPDGRTWTPISREAFNLAPNPDHPNSLAKTAFVAVDPPGTLLLATCGECPVRLWGTADGQTWTVMGSIDESFVIGLEAALGDRLVVAAWVCIVEPCHTSIWVLGEDGTFSRVRDDLLLDHPKLAFNGHEYVLVGLDSTDVAVHHLHAFVSADGRAWKEIDTMGAAAKECPINDLLGSDSGALFLGQNECHGIWRLEVEPG